MLSWIKTGLRIALGLLITFLSLKTVWHVERANVVAGRTQAQLEELAALHDVDEAPDTTRGVPPGMLRIHSSLYWMMLLQWPLSLPYIGQPAVRAWKWLTSPLACGLSYLPRTSAMAWPKKRRFTRPIRTVKNNAPRASQATTMGISRPGIGQNSTAAMGATR